MCNQIKDEKVIHMETVKVPEQPIQQLKQSDVIIEDHHDVEEDYHDVIEEPVQEEIIDESIDDSSLESHENDDIPTFEF